MNSDSLSESFLQISEKKILPEYLEHICNKIVDRTISRQAIEEILEHAAVNEAVAKVEFLHLIFEYIKIALADNLLTRTEKENIKYLKLLFSIKAGDFFLHNKFDIESTIACQLSTIYQDDYITDEEALLKVDLQEIFDLTFDEMNEYSKLEAARSIKNGN